MHNNNYKLEMKEKPDLLQVKAAEQRAKLACGHIKVDNDSSREGTKSCSDNNNVQGKKPT